jgi:hypothetical protein
VSVPGNNLPEFVARQLAFAAHIRNPELYPVPAGIDARRMRVYVELFFNNIEALLAGALPVTKALLGPEDWPALVRRFIHEHGSQSPYFLEVAAEFLRFLSESKVPCGPAFLLELCHYEWVELSLTTAEAPTLPAGLDPAADLLTGRVVRSPLAWLLSYAYPVHRIGPDFQPVEPDPEPTQLVVYRRADDSVHFMQVNALTQRLLLLLDGTRSGREALDQLRLEVPGIDQAQIERGGQETLEQLRAAEIILGAMPHWSGTEPPGGERMV